MELRDYLIALRNHWVGALLIVVLAGAAALGVSLTQEKVYAANANGLVSTGASENPALGSVNDQLAQSKATTYVDIATSRATARGVIAELDLDETPSSLVTRISVEQPIDTPLVKITATGSSPKQAQELADAWVSALADQVKEIEAPNGKLIDGTPRVVPVESAELPTAPISPKIERNAALGLVLGAMLGLGYAVLRRTLDRRLRTPADIESRFTVPVVASIPSSPVLKHAAGQRADIAVDQTGAGEGHSAAAEAFRKLRTNLIYMDVDNPPRVLVVTSPRPGDGKSTVAANIAAALASSGQPVVLVDADLRRPSVAASFGLDNAAGLSSVLAGQIPVEAALQSPADAGALKILAAGPIPPNPSEMLGSKAMRALVAKIAVESYVVLDAPPLLPVTDAAVLTAASDGAFIVVSSGQTLDTELATCLNSLDKVKGRPLGIVLNRIPIRRGSASYYGYYGGYDAAPPADEAPAKPPKTPRHGGGSRRA